MKKIISGKTYNTETATEICGYEYSNSSDFSYCKETLYCTRKGAYFLYGEGGAMSKYARSCGQNEWCGGDAITPMSPEKAREWAEKHGSVDAYIEFFGEPDEAGEDGASKIREARESRGWSRTELARKLGAPIRTLEDWEAGRRHPAEWIEKIIVEKIERMD